MTGAAVPPPEEKGPGPRRTPWGTLGLRWRLTLYLGGALVVLLVAFAALSLQAVNQAQHLAFSQQLHLAHTIAAGLEREVDHVSSDVRTYVSEAPSPARAQAAVAVLLNHLASLENLGYFRVSSVRLVDSQGKVLAAAPFGTSTLASTLPPREIIRQVMSSDRTAIASSRLPAEGSVPFAAVVVPLPPSPDSPQGAAVVVDTVGLGTIMALHPPKEAAGAEASYRTEVVDADGIIRATSEGEVALGRASMHYSIVKGFMARGDAGAVVHHMPGGTEHPDHIVAIVPLQGTPFFLVVEESLGLLLGWPQQLRTQALILGGIAVVIVVALGWIVSRNMVRPVVALRRATARIRGGDLESPVRVPAQGELAQLVEEVEEMRQRLRETVSSLDGLNRSLADQVRERTQQLRTVVARLMQAQEEERHRVARDLHDETAQGLTALGVILDGVALDAEESGSKALPSVRDAREQVRRLVAETRRLAYALRPSILDDAGLAPALRWCAEAYLETSNIQVSLEFPDPGLRLPEPVEVALFRVGQEAMSNIAKHARAFHAWVTLERRGALAILTIRDDGIGFDAATMLGEEGPPQARGLGLLGMKERIELLGGQLRILSRLGEGTILITSVPTHTWEEGTG